MVMDRIFRTPPDKPDTRMIFIGGCGIITFFRGLNILFGNQPQAELFNILGEFFVLFWGGTWTLVGLFVLIVAISGHRFPRLDLAAAYLLLCIWWLWALIYLLSAIFTDVDRIAGFLAAFILLITGFVLTAGIMMNIRKTQLLALNAALKDQVETLNADLARVADRSKELRKELGDNEL